MNSSKLKRMLKHIKYRLILLFTPRKNRVYTQFNRFPHQYQALVENVIPAYLSCHKNDRGRLLEIVVFACCNGAEPYTLSYVLRTNFPTLKFRIRAFDIVPEVIEQAKSRTYSHGQVYSSPFINEKIVEDMFTIDADDNYIVKPNIANDVFFSVGDMLDNEFLKSLGKIDLLFAQNVLFHLPKPKAKEAFVNLVSLLKLGSTLFVNGMDTDMRIRLTKKYSLHPLEYLIEEIHNDARVDRGSAWSGAYWGREPFSRSSRNWVRKQCTIFKLV